VLHFGDNLGEGEMLKQIVILAALIASPAMAQQAPADPVATTYAQLLGEANGRIAQCNAQFQHAQEHAADLQKQLDALKPKDKSDAK
jgi:hypothetical protein